MWWVEGEIGRAKAHQAVSKPQSTHSTQPWLANAAKAWKKLGKPTQHASLVILHFPMPACVSSRRA